MSPTRENIVLIGMPGAGKSTLGVVLAKIMNLQFVDADLVIQHETGQTLQDTIDQQGAEGFLEVENRILRQLEAHESVIATGGSAVYSDEAMRHLRTLGKVVYLRISYDSLVERLGDLQERGVVMKGGASMTLRDLYAERQPLYERYAHITVDVDGLTITDAARKVAAAISA